MTMNEPLPHPNLLLQLDALRDKAMAAETLPALAFSMAWCLPNAIRHWSC